MGSSKSVFIKFSGMHLLNSTQFGVLTQAGGKHETGNWILKIQNGYFKSEDGLRKKILKRKKFI